MRYYYIQLYGIKHFSQWTEVIKKDRPEVGVIIPEEEVVLIGSGTHTSLVVDFYHLMGVDDPDHFKPYLAFFISPASNILIRWDYQAPKLDLIWKADDLLTSSGISPEQISFLYNRELFHELGVRGQKWRLFIDDRKNACEIKVLIASRTPLYKGSKLCCHYNPCNGNRIITYSELENYICTREANTELGYRLKTVLELMTTFNMRHKPELQVFKVSLHKLKDYFLELIQSLSNYPDEQSAKTIANRLLEALKSHLEGEFYAQDDFDNPEFHVPLYCMFSGITREQHKHDLSREFQFNLRWISGGRSIDSHFSTNRPKNESSHFEKGIVNHFRIKLVPERHDIKAYNLGMINNTLSLRAPQDGSREVMILEVVLSNCLKNFFIRRVKWDTCYQMTKYRISQQEALHNYDQYVNYIFDRQQALTLLCYNIPTLSYFEESGNPPRGYICRDYIYGYSIDKLSRSRLQNKAFFNKLLPIIGRAAACNLFIGRINAKTGTTHFCDGDEIVILDSSGQPYDYVMADFTGAFSDTTSQYSDLIVNYAQIIKKVLFTPANVTITEEMLAPLLTCFHKRLYRLRDLAGQFTNRAIFYARNDQYNFETKWQQAISRILDTDIEALERQLKIELLK